MGNAIKGMDVLKSVRCVKKIEGGWGMLITSTPPPAYASLAPALITLDGSFSTFATIQGTHGAL